MTPRSRPRTDDALVGAAVTVPGSVFNEPGSVSYPAVVLRRTPRRAAAYDVRFDDGSEYWFPAADVAAWAAGRKTGAAASPGRTRRVSAGRVSAAAKAAPSLIDDALSTAAVALVALAGAIVLAATAVTVARRAGGDDKWRLPW